MTCPACGADTLAFPVSDDLRDYLPDDRPGAELCTVCLHVDPLDDPPADLPDFTTVSDAFPQDREDAALMACLLALAASPAHYRSELQHLVTDAELTGVDPFLVLSRLQRDPDIDPHFDLERRTRQLEQLI